MAGIETLRDGLYGNPPSPTWKPSREALLAAFSEIYDALGASGIADTIFADQATGLSATSNGDLFLVQASGVEFARLYKNVSGAAVDQNIALPSSASLADKADVSVVTAIDQQVGLLTETIGQKADKDDLAAKANTADLSDVATSGSYDDLSDKPVLGSAAQQPVTAFATPAQGAKADSALQPAALVPFDERITTAEQQVGGLSDLIARAPERAGDSRSLFSSFLTGEPTTRPTIGGAKAVASSVGTVLRIAGADASDATGYIDVAPKIAAPVYPDRTYLVRVRLRRNVDPTDPAGNAVELRWQNLGAAKSAVSNALLQSALTPVVADGVIVRSFLVGKAGAPGALNYTIPPTAVYGLPFIRIYGTGQETDIIAIDGPVDVTDYLVGGADVPVILEAAEAAAEAAGRAETAALEAQDAAAAATASVMTFETRQDVVDYSGSLAADLIQVRRYDANTPVSPGGYYSRDTASSSGAFQAGGVWWKPADPITYLETFGARGNGVTNDQDAFDVARELGRAFYLTAEYLVTDGANTLGVPFLGPGNLIKAVPGGFVQINSHLENGPTYFRNVLWRVKNRQLAGELIKIAVFGDSTATNAYGLNIAGFIQDELRNVGSGVDVVTNLAVAGSTWGTNDLSVMLTGIGSQQHLAICKFGLNDASTGDITLSLIALRDSMRQRLSEIRASTYGDYDDLSILLLMPNALGNTEDNATNRNDLWLEAIVGIYVEAARDFECAIYNPYPEASVAEDGGDRWLDDDLIHPQVNYNLDIWGRALDLIKPHGSIKRNRFLNYGAGEQLAPPAANSLASYNNGQSILRAFSSDGWPVTGCVLTIRNPDNPAVQILFGYQIGSFAEVVMRTWIVGANVWSEWSNADHPLNVAIPLTVTSSLESARYWRTMDGSTVIAGTIRPTGAVSQNSKIAELPSNYRPALQVVRYAKTLTDMDVRLRVYPNGDVFTETAIPAGAYVTFQNLTFKAVT
ncbi:SGNH/GDSL hydrolase family protein [Sphingobium sp. CR2-8]|uniref:SGNH/GDSL hydrolase family protein n=1 Tax=Sphingobium sp. CR2-8 TaxID=1306534 RepID=UPI002DC0557C|nr:SGNH/GDSL hydrolase family protein [Sphingobium sp. CR2-8]MEC3912200.1 SGNH/GDSL hydrolase family protein [Sphingobium sp. CR2-8]